MISFKMLYSLLLFVLPFCAALVWWLVSTRRRYVLPVSIVCFAVLTLILPKVQANPPAWVGENMVENAIASGAPLSFCIAACAIIELTLFKPRDN